MNAFQIPTSVVERLGWVLVHSAWEFAIIALVAMAIQRAMERCSATVRYWTLLVSLAGMVVSPAVTWLNLPADTPVARVAVVSDQGVQDPSESARSRVDRDPAAASGSDLLGAAGAPLAEQPGVSDGPILGGFVRGRWWASVEAGVKPWLRSIVAIWCLGVVTFGLRPLLSWYTVRRLRSVGVSPVPAAVAAMLHQTAERLRLRQAVQILQSTLTRLPIVIGYLRPVILLPASVLSGVPTSQLEAILAHELAHVRRHDFLVNLLQTLVETVFFYHPAVWWLSHRIRVERENCCDDLAVAALGNRVEYGRALLAIEELRGTATALALGVRSGSLLDRVRRLFGRDPAKRALGAGGVFGFGLLALVIIVVGVWASTQADDEKATQGATVALEGGIQIKLLGVSYQPSENRPWWKPEGGALPGDPTASRWNFSKSHVHDEGEHRELALEITGAERDVHAWVDFAPGDKLGPWSTYWDFQDDAQSGKKVTLLRAVSAGFPKGEKQRDVLVRLAVAPWHPYQVIDLKRDKPQPEEKPEEKPEEQPEDGTVLLRRVRQLTDGTTQVDLVYPAKFELRAHHEVVGEDLDGNKVELYGITVADAGARGLMFRCPQDRLAKVRIRFRWYTHEVTFRDVSLHPQHVTQVKAKVTKLEPPPEPGQKRDVNVVVAQIANAEYVRPTADDQRATATIPVEAWGEPVNGLRVAIVLRSPPVDKDERLCYDIVAENVSDHDIRFSARVGNRGLAFCKIELVDADGIQVAQQQGMMERWRPSLIRFWLKPQERTLILPWNTQLARVAEQGEPIAEPKRHYVHPFFNVTPGRYSVSATVELGPSMYSLDPASETRTVLSPAKGEWSGTLQTGPVAVALFTDAEKEGPLAKVAADKEGPLAKPATEQKTGRIEGRVFAFPEIRLSEEQKRKLVPDSAEVGDIPEVRIRSIKLYLRGSGQVSAEAEVGEDGTFVFEAAPTGSVRLHPSFQVGEFNTSLSGLNVPTTVREGETTRVAFFGKGRPIVGKVLLPENIKAENVRIRLTLRANPVRRTTGPDGNVRPNIDWRLYEPLAIKDQFELDKDGQFRIDGVREGVYRITADAADGPTRIRLSFDGTVKAGDPNVVYGEFTVPLMAGGESDKPHDLGTLRFKLPSHEE